MTLKAKVDKLDDIDTKYHDLYEEKEGAFFLKPIEGFKPQAEFDVVHTALGKERIDHKASKTKLLAFGDLDPVAVREQLDKIPSLEEAIAKGTDDAKINAIVEQRVAQKTTPLQRQLTEATTKLTAAEQKAAELEGREKNRTLGEQVRGEAKKLKVRDTAIDDVALYGERLFELSDDGKATAKANSGLMAGTTPEMWLRDQQSVKPHWWETTGGGGGRGGSGNGFDKNPWSKEHWNMTEQSNVARTDQAKAERMAKAAGVHVGATGPKKD